MVIGEDERRLGVFKLERDAKHLKVFSMVLYILSSSWESGGGGIRG